MNRHKQPGIASPHPHREPPGQVLMIDADDTLWENNIYFEQAIANYVSFLDHRVHTPAEVREHLNRVERQTIAASGYGLKSFRASLTRCLEELLQVTATEEQHARIAGFVDHIGSHAIEVLSGVRDTLGGLATRHHVVLVTKGDPEEQMAKLSASGLQPHFAAAEVLAEKHEVAYRELVQRHGFEPARTWMIGNSPKSDINPALAAGLNAVLIPHEYTWVLEHEAVAQAPAGQRLITAGSFADLNEYF